MGKVMMREVMLLLVTGLYGWLVIPVLMGQPRALPLLYIGLFLGLTFMPLHALTLMIGKRLSNLWRWWVGLFAWMFAFGSTIQLVVMVLTEGARLAPRALALEVVPPLLGLLLPVMAAVWAPAGQRGRSAAWALLFYSLPMWIVRDVLLRIVGPSLILTVMGMTGGALYMFLHGVLRIVAPTPAEDETRTAPLLVRRPVPDAVVGLVEGTLHRSARPYATTAEGTDNRAISVLCSPDEVEAVREKLTAALGERPFTVSRGEAVKGQVEVVIRPRD